MEKWSYDEIREWFWVRTGVWSLPVAVLSVIALMFYWHYSISDIEPNLWICIGVGVTVTLLGVLAALISIQFPWMRSGWKFGFAPNAVICAAIASLCSFLIGGIVLSFMQNDAFHRPSYDVIDAAYKILTLAVVLAAVWGIIYGSWFAMRRDRYFVEPI